MSLRDLSDDLVSRLATLTDWPEDEREEIVTVLAREVQEWRRSNLADVLTELDAALAYIDDLEHQIRDLQRSDTLDRAMPT